ncbi:MAG TPA: hypothetical protein VGN31_09270 [Paraburkholderia sp.]
MSYCNKCRYPIPDPLADLQIFCPHCGAVLDDDETLPAPADCEPDSAAIQHVVHSPAPAITPTVIGIPAFGEVEPPADAKQPFQFKAINNGTSTMGLLTDAKGRGWFVRKNRGNSDLYHWCKVARSKKKGGGNFNMAMRLERTAPTLSRIAADLNHRQRAIEMAGYQNLSLEHAMLDTVRNTGARQSQGSVMAKFFQSVADGTARGLTAPLNTISREHAQKAVTLCENGSLSASRYMDLPGQEWLHLRGHGLGGTEEAGNLVAGSHGANSEMAAIEMVLQQFSATKSLTYSVRADCLAGTLLCVAIVMQVQINGQRIFDRTIAPTRERLSQIDYAHIQDELVNRIVTEGREGRKIEFVPASAPD